MHRVLGSKNGQVMGKRPRMRRKYRMGRRRLSPNHYSEFIRQAEVRIERIAPLPCMSVDNGPFLNNEFGDLVKQVIENILKKPSGQLADPVRLVSKYWLPERTRKVVTEEAFNVYDFSEDTLFHFHDGELPSSGQELGLFDIEMTALLQMPQ